MAKEHDAEDWVKIGAPIPRFTSYEALADGWLTIVWASGKVARLQVTEELAAQCYVEYTIRDGVTLERRERNFGASFDGTADPAGWETVLEALAVEQDQPIG